MTSQSTGDFNVEIDIDDLTDGSNTVVISATDNESNITDKTVTVNYSAGNTWNTTYNIDWSSESNIQDVAQVVDGKWELTGSGVKTTESGYNRYISIGDM